MLPRTGAPRISVYLARFVAVALVTAGYNHALLGCGMAFCVRFGCEDLVTSDNRELSSS
jgi:hypothetical protein